MDGGSIVGYLTLVNVCVLLNEFPANEWIFSWMNKCIQFTECLQARIIFFLFPFFLSLFYCFLDDIYFLQMRWCRSSSWYFFIQLFASCYEEIFKRCLASDEDFNYNLLEGVLLLGCYPLFTFSRGMVVWRCVLHVVYAKNFFYIQIVRNFNSCIVVIGVMKFKA